MTQVYKFGGASVKDATAIRNVATILRQNNGSPKVVVISAMGKTTNALEQVVNAFHAGSDDAYPLLHGIRDFHLGIAKELQIEASEPLKAFFADAEEFLREEESGNYTYIYDQVVSTGELASTYIIQQYLANEGINCSWLDVRKVLLTDRAYTEARVNWEVTEEKMQQRIPAMLQKGHIITQGFLGSTPEGLTTTLGREGSDYTAAILAYCLRAEKLTIWKDVPGVLCADPKQFPNATLIPELSFREAIEMSYYGAKVIHPKTIKPLQNRSIPLAVRSFVEPTVTGTLIREGVEADYPPVIVYKENQILLSFAERDFSFIAEEHLSAIFREFAENRLRMNLMQNGAISFTAVVDYKEEKIEAVKKALGQQFSIKSNDILELLTIRHYNNQVINDLTAGKQILLEQKSRTTIQFLMR